MTPEEESGLVKNIRAVASVFVPGRRRQFQIDPDIWKAVKEDENLKKQGI